MSGPCSLPEGSKEEWEQHNDIVCNIHFNCDMDADKPHEYITYRMWLQHRHRLVTGKTR